MSESQRQSGRIDREMPARLTPAQPIPDAGGKEVVRATAIGESPSLTAKERQRALTARLMEQVCEPANLNRAYARVTANKGSPGIDGMPVGQLGGWIKRHKQSFIASLLDGSYRPRPVRGVQIPKPGGKGMRQLGIPTVIANCTFLQPAFGMGSDRASIPSTPRRAVPDSQVQAHRQRPDAQSTG
jgi:RNA-directed DNA polymerase